MTNAIVSAENTAAEFNTGIFCSIHAESQADRLRIYDAVSNACSLDDNIGKVIAVTDVIIQPVESVDNATGENIVRNRIVLIDEDGNAYGCMSSGVETSIRNLFAIVGPAPWAPALPLVAEKRQGRNGYKFTSLSIAH